MNKNRIVQSVIVGLATLVATVTWVGLKNVLFTNGHWLWPSIGFLILLIFLSLNWLLTKSRVILLFTLIFILISFVFAFGFKLEYLAALFIALLFFVFGSYRAIKEKENGLKIHPGKIFKKGLPWVITGLALIIATVYYFSPWVLQGQNQIEIPRSLFDTVSQPIIGTLNQTLGNQLLVQKDLLYQMTNETINKHSQEYREYLNFGLALGLFFALKAIGVVFVWLVILLSSLIFKVLVTIGAIKVQEKAVLQQVIEI